MGYCDECSCRVLDVASISVTTGTVFQLTVAPRTLYDGMRYVLRLPQTLPLPDENGLEPVTISDGATAYPVQDRIGNVLLSGRLRGRRRYGIVFGDNPAHFQLCEASCCLEYYPNGAAATP